MERCRHPRCAWDCGRAGQGERGLGDRAAPYPAAESPARTDTRNWGFEEPDFEERAEGCLGTRAGKALAGGFPKGKK